VNGVEDYLSSVAKGTTFREVFGDWMAANILNQGEGPYANQLRPVDVRIDSALNNGASVDGEASQFGTNYYDIEVEPGTHVLRFTGAASVDVLPVEPDDGGFYWSNAGDSIDTRLTSTEVDVPAGGAALTFRTWHDVERWFDWGYIAASTDGGTTWRTLGGAHTSDDDAVRIAVGQGYTGRSGGGAEAQWVDERINLSAFAGQRVQLRFEYVTDGSTHGEGWVVDDINIEGVSDQPAWTSEGWVLVDQPLPQSYIVRVIGERADGEAIVLDVPLNASQSGELRFDSTGLVRAVVGVAGTTEGTNQSVPYTLLLDP
jgi:hypothetical protein